MALDSDSLGRAAVGFVGAMLGVAVVGALVGLPIQQVLVFGVALGVGFALGALFVDRS
jgi:hypothetical protein